MAQANAVLDVTSTDWPEAGGLRSADDALIVKFHLHSVKNNFRSTAEQREIFEDVEYCEIMRAGDQLSTIDRPATEIDKRRFPRHYAAFKRGMEGMSQQPGTPLSQWTILGPSAVKMLNAQNFWTVDQVAAASDLQIQAVGMHAGMEPLTFREKARTFIKVAKDSALADRQAAEITKLREEAAAKDVARDKEIAELRAMLAEQKKDTITLGKKA